ncbi:hypothetical protein ACP3TJ_10400 [Desulforudis sp. 1088]
MYKQAASAFSNAPANHRHREKDGRPHIFVPLVHVSITTGEVLLNKLAEHWLSETVQREERHE